MLNGLTRLIQGNLMSFDNSLLEKQIYAGITCILKNSNNYYSYSNFLNDQGKEAIMDFIIHMAPLIMKNEQKILDERAKAIVVEQLKK